MAFGATKIPYQHTEFFSKIVIDYLNKEADLIPFFKHEVNTNSLQDVIQQRLAFDTNRNILVSALEAQYQNIPITETVKQNISLLKKATTFTITTAHQPNIFTGPLYFLYKILHAIRLSEYCKAQFPQYDFVPVYYMGSEDADLDELGHIFIQGKKITWNTNQTGAVGRMLVDKNFLRLIDMIAGEVGIQTFGEEIISIIKKSYTEGEIIQVATLKLVNELFGKYGLLVVIPDNSILKAIATEIFKEELLQGHSLKIVEETGLQLNEAGYNAQAHSRAINLFYLKDDLRERIEKNGEDWKVNNTDVSFSKDELLKELIEHPERFSPNVILRGIFQETILPNIAFIGGGGELAYWLQLKALFDFYKVPYPMLLLRNSFLIIDEKSSVHINKLGLSPIDIFKPVLELQNSWTEKNTSNNLSVDTSLQTANDLYKNLSQQALSIDSTLLQHIEALKTAAIKRIDLLGKKMLRAEKRNHETAMRQIEKLKQKLFPNHNLQERIDNFIPYYAKYGAGLIDELYKNSLAVEQEFIVLEKI